MLFLTRVEDMHLIATEMVMPQIAPYRVMYLIALEMAMHLIAP